MESEKGLSQADASTTEAPEKVTLPDEVVAILTADLEKTMDKIEKLQSALRFYMSAFTWCAFDEKVRPSLDMFKDAGNVAREALGVPLLRDYYLRGEKLS